LIEGEPMAEQASKASSDGLSASIMKTAVTIEEFGIDFYSRMSECVADEKGAALLRSLANDEKEHKAILEKQLLEISRTFDISKAEPMGEYLGVLAKNVFVAPPEGACLLLEDEISALEKGITVEISSRKMYEDAMTRVQDEKVRSTLQQLAEWEGRHQEILEENLRLLRLEGAWYGYGPILEG
jgi:rubrerythrin